MKIPPAITELLQRKRRRAVLATGIATLLTAYAVHEFQAATVLTEAGVTFTFDTIPGATEWSTSGATGTPTFIGGAGGDIVDATAMDAKVATFPATQFGTQLVTSSTAGGSSTNAQGRYNSTELYISTRPTGVSLAPLMATLQNGAGGRVSSLAIDYNMGSYLYDAATADPGLDAFRVYYSLDGTSWTNIAPLSNNLEITQKQSATVNLTWEDGAPLYLLWIDDNGPGTDGGFTLDNVHLVPTLQPIVIGRNLVYNRTHSVGSAPNGELSTTGNYFLEGNVPTAFATTDVVNFSQAGNTAINVPADVTTGGVVVSHASGTYTIGGTGKISGPLTKSGAGNVVFTSPNAFTRSTITGGTVETQAGALGGGLVTISGNALWKVTTAAQTQNGSLSIGDLGATIQTDFDLTANGVDGTGPLKKTGTGTLTLRGGGTGTGGIDIQNGKLALAGAVGGAGEIIKLNGHPLDFVNTGEITFNDAANLRTIDFGTAGVTISVIAPGSGAIFGGNETLVGTGTITKTGEGALRMRSDQFSLTSNWVVDNGTLEHGQFGTALGTGTVTVNPLGRLAGQNTLVASNVTLAGGNLGTRSGDLTDFSGAINVTAPSRVTMISYTTIANAQNITISGLLSGTGDLTLNGNIVADPLLTKALILTNSANTYSGTFHVSAGQTLTAQPVSGTGSTLNTRPVVLSNGTLRIRDEGTGNDGTIVYGNNVTTDTGISTIDVDHPTNGVSTGNTIQLGTLTAGAPTLAVIGANDYKVRFAGGTTLASDVTFETAVDLMLSGAVSGSFGLTKAGTGRMFVDAVNTYTGPTTVSAGTLLVNGTLPASSSVTVNGTLGGTGAVGGAVAVGATGTIAPGVAIGTLSASGDVAFAAGSTFSVQLSHGTGATPVAGTDYDRLSVGNGAGVASTGAVNVTDSQLVLSIGTGIRQGDLFFILLNDGIDAVTGTFAGLPDDSIFVQGDQQFRISYDANSATGSLLGGNDIALSALSAVPEPASAALLLLGSALLLPRRRRVAVTAGK